MEHFKGSAENFSPNALDIMFSYFYCTRNHFHCWLRPTSNWCFILWRQLAHFLVPISTASTCSAQTCAIWYGQSNSVSHRTIFQPIIFLSSITLWAIIFNFMQISLSGGQFRSVHLNLANLWWWEACVDFIDSYCKNKTNKKTAARSQ